jgi:hypothetical protein
VGVTVAIHQPNYLPWLGYFHKIASVDVFVFVDDVQFPKNSYTNRVQVLGPDSPRWLTVPVTYDFGDTIREVRPAVPDWPSRHLDTLRTLYGSAPAFKEVWARVQELLLSLPQADLATINRCLIERLCGEFGLSPKFSASSEFNVHGKVSDDRLIELVKAVAPSGVYLSGKGAAGYQDPEKFKRAGLGFRYLDFQHPVYDQGRSSFQPGMSVLDPLFRLGWSGTADLIAATTCKA